MVLYPGIICGSCDDVLDKLIEAGTGHQKPLM